MKTSNAVLKIENERLRRELAEAREALIVAMKALGEKQLSPVQLIPIPYPVYPPIQPTIPYHTFTIPPCPTYNTPTVISSIN